MKRQAIFILPIFILLSAALLSAQSGNEVEITNEPHHHLTFENQYVRVFNVQVDPNTQTETHWHRHDYISITLGDAEIANNVEGKPTVNTKLPDGDVRFASGVFAHYVRDLDPQPFRNVTIELLQDQSLRDSAAAGKFHWDEDRGLDVLTKGTRNILFVKDGVRVTEFELQPGGIAPLHHHASPELLVVISDLDIRSDVKSDDPKGPQGPMRGNFKSGDHKWLPGNYSHTITNTGGQPAKFVTLEFP